MKSVREVLSTVVVLFLGLGYAGSQWAALNGPQATKNWATAIDKPSVAQFSLVLMAFAAIFMCLRVKNEER
jgi:hypothetical protein